MSEKNYDKVDELSDDEVILEIYKHVKSRNPDRRSPYERTRDAVYATGNKWAIENFNATH